MGYSTIAVYGVHYIGECLIKDLMQSKIKVLYGIDKNIEAKNTGLKIYNPIDELPKVDLIVVTSTIYYYEIRRMLLEKVNCSVVSIEEVVERMN